LIPRRLFVRANIPNWLQDHLQTAFPYVPKPFIRKIFVQHKNLYAPTHIYFTDLFKRYNQPPNVRPAPYGSDYPFFPRKTPYKPPTMMTLKDAEFEKESQWVLIYNEEAGDLVRVRARISAADDDDPSQNEVDPKGKGKATADDQEDEDEEQCLEGEGIECNCCFTEYQFVSYSFHFFSFYKGI
jgi:TRIAD3 protein (E3 ubiquitin-protein ligase RNF216)